MKPLDQLVAEDVMHADLLTVAPDVLLDELRQRLLESRVSGLPVVDDGRLVGIVSRTDLVRVAALAEALDGALVEEWQERTGHMGGSPMGGSDMAGSDMTGSDMAGSHMTGSDMGASGPPTADQAFRQRLGQLRVRDAMRSQVVTCTRRAPLAEVARAMLTSHVHRVVVVDGEQPVGIVSALDLAALLAGP